MVSALTYGVIALVAFALTRSIRRSFTTERSEVWSVFRSLRWWMPFASVAMFATMLTCLRVILDLVPALSWGWWSMLGGSGSLVAGQTGNTGPVAVALGFIIPVLLVFAVPREAYIEEEVFRGRHEAMTPARRALSNVTFGMAHCVVGVPLATGIVLSLGGWYFSLVYRLTYARTLSAIEEMTAHHPDTDDHALRVDDERTHRAAARLAALRTAAAAHAVSNWIIVSFILGWFAWTAGT